MWWMPLPPSSSLFVLHLYEVRTCIPGIQAASLTRLPRACADACSWFTFRWTHPVPPPQRPAFLFPIPTAQSHDQSTPWRVVRIPVAVFARPVGHWCVWGRWKVKEDLFIITGSKRRSDDKRSEPWLQQCILYPVVSTCPSTLTKCFWIIKHSSFSRYQNPVFMSAWLFSNSPDWVVKILHFIKKGGVEDVQTQATQLN